MKYRLKLFHEESYIKLRELTMFYQNARRKIIYFQLYIYIVSDINKSKIS